MKKEWYLELLSSLRALDPALKIKSFTAIEIRHLAERVFKLPIRETLEALRAAGLNAITGGGAEIFDQGVRDQICRGKENAEEWLEVHRIWHQMGERSTCTMLYGHIETVEQRVDHLRRLRELQDETGGFTGFIPFAFVPETTEMAHIKPASAFEELRNLAVSRIYLDNIDHITGYWVALGAAAGVHRAELRRGRSARDDRGGENLPHGGSEDAAAAAHRDAGEGDPRGGPHSGAAQYLLRPRRPGHASRAGQSRRA